MHKAIWGFIFPGKKHLDVFGEEEAWSNKTFVNGTPGYLYIPSKAPSPDRLPKGHYFCLGIKGDNRMTCGLPRGGIARDW